MIQNIPACVRAKLAALAEAANDADDIARASLARLMNLPAAERTGPKGQRLKERGAEYRSRHENIAPQWHRGNQRINELPSVTVLEEVAPPIISLEKGETYPDRARKIRAKIATLTIERNNVRAAPSPAADLKKLVRQFAENLLKSLPRVVYQRDLHGHDHIQWASTGRDVESIGGAVAALLDMKALVAKFEGDLGGLAADPPGAMSYDARLKKLAEIEDELDVLEREDEQCITLAAERGEFIERRFNASIEAVLGVRVVKSVAAAAAA